MTFEAIPRGLMVVTIGIMVSFLLLSSGAGGIQALLNHRFRQIPAAVYSDRPHSNFRFTSLGKNAGSNRFSLFSSGTNCPGSHARSRAARMFIAGGTVLRQLYVQPWSAGCTGIVTTPRPTGKFTYAVRASSSAAWEIFLRAVRYAFSAFFPGCPPR